MTMSDYIRNLRAKIGNDLLMLPTVSGVLFNEAGEVLMIQHTDAGQWLLPGGMIEPEESPRQAVLREMQEELGVEVEITGLIDVNSGPEFLWTYRNGHQVCFVMSTFACRVVGGEFNPDPREILEIRFVGANEWQQLGVTAWVETTLPIVFADFKK